MKTKLIMAFGLIFVFALIAFWDMQTLPQNHTTTTQNANPSAHHLPAPDISFETLDDKKHNLSDFKGRIVLLNFWASWCLPCLTEFPQMMDIINDLNGDAVLIAISKDKNKADIEKFLNKFPKYKNTPYLKIVHDQNAQISEGLFNTFKIPETIIINKDGLMVRKIIGADPIWETDQIREDLKQLFAK